METFAVANPRAASGRVERSWREYERQIASAFGAVEIEPTRAPGDATRMVRRALQSGARRIVAIGGDGTVNEVVNGFFGESGQPLGAHAELVVFPAGTGGDFARSIGMHGARWADAVQAAEPRTIDVGRARLTDRAGAEILRHFVNISSFGASGLIVDKVNRTSKALGGKLSFLLGTVRGLLAYETRRCRIRIDDTFEEDLPVTVVAVANGRYFGGSMMVAPDAQLDDGVFDIVLITGIGPIDFVRYAPKIYAGKHLQLPGIRRVRGKRLLATPLDGEVLIDVDGEQPGRLPVSYEIVPRGITLRAPWGPAAAAS